jgi:hypothetical protein
MAPGGSPRPRSVLARRAAVLAVIAVVALALTATQTVATCLLSGRTTVHDAYRALGQWDGGWFWSVAAYGYCFPEHPSSRNPGNVAFFPGYPLSAALVARLTGLDTWTALLVAAQVACCGFWSYLFLLCRRWGVPPPVAGAGALLLAAHPGAFFLVASYSEPLFLCSALGFVYWSDRPGRLAAVLAALHGALMTATRLVGLPLVVYPLLRAWLTVPPGHRHDVPGLLRSSTRALLVGAAASLGLVSFFGYCAYRFGYWDACVRCHAIGWAVHPRYRALFNLNLFHVGTPRSGLMAFDPVFVSRLCVPVFLVTFIALAVWEASLAARRKGQDTGWKTRLPLYLCSFLLFYVPVAGFFTTGMVSMSRFTVVVQAVLTPAVLHFVARSGAVSRRVRAVPLVGFVLWAVTAILFQAAMAYRFTRGFWVA